VSELVLNLSGCKGFLSKSGQFVPSFKLPDTIQRFLCTDRNGEELEFRPGPNSPYSVDEPYQQFLIQVQEQKGKGSLSSERESFDRKQVENGVVPQDTKKPIPLITKPNQTKPAR
jgi:hypothetical protein